MNSILFLLIMGGAVFALLLLLSGIFGALSDVIKQLKEIIDEHPKY